jgi:hypothetical protein
LASKFDVLDAEAVILFVTTEINKLNEAKKWPKNKINIDE